MFKLRRPWNSAFAPRAVPADLFACYRLLLGRPPSAEEWAVHEGRIGGDLRALVAAFTGSAEFARRGLLPPPADVESDLQRTATAADIRYCFRLLLGRAPNREEWLGHSTQVGDPLDGVVAGYLGSLEFSRRAPAPKVAGQVRLTQQDGFRIYADAEDAAVGRHVACGRYEPDVTATLRRLLRPGMAVIDIGANIGFMALLSASIVGPAGSVLAIEPNPRNARMLEASRRECGFAQLTLCQAAAGRETGLLVLNTTHSNGTTSQAHDIESLLGAETVACLRVDALVPAELRIDVIKVDVEGAEYNALLGCERILRAHRPTIVSEFSPDLIGSISGISGPDYLRWLEGLGYRLAVIEPDGSASPLADAAHAMAAYEARGVDHIDILASARSGVAELR